MKFTTVLGLLSLLTPAVIGRPLEDDEGDVLPQKSRVTAFVIDDHGNPSVECWEFSNMVSDMMKVRRNDGSTARAHSIEIAKGGELDGLDILTWPPLSPIWPNPDAIGDDEMKGNWLDLSNTFNLFNIQGGLINFKFSIFARQQMGIEEEVPDHVFSLENGDDWFYFEDKYTGTERVDAADPPFLVNSVSGSNTEALRLRFPKRPKYKVVHKGGCDFTGIITPDESSSSRRKSPWKSSLTKQHRPAEL